MPPSSGSASSARAAGILLAALASLAACAGDQPEPACDRTAPNMCAPPAPSYAGQVSAIVAQHCQPCHRPGGQEAVRPLTSYAQVSKSAIDVFFQVSRCKMPPADQPPLAPAEVQALFAWLVCGAPNN